MSSHRTAPINRTRSTEVILREVLLEDNRLMTIQLRPGELVIDVLRRRGIDQDFIEVAAGTRRIIH